MQEIGERLHISRNTVKSELISLYRKLGVSSRSEAVARADDLGLHAWPKSPHPDLRSSLTR